MENTNQKNFPTSGVGYSSYPQPGFCHPGPPETNYLQSPPPPYQQLQPQFAAGISNQPMGVTPVVVVFEPPISMAGAIVLSCFVFWCFGWLFGLIAFILASKYTFKHSNTIIGLNYFIRCVPSMKF